MSEKVKIRKVKAFHNKDLVQRVNFLQQASKIVSTKNKNLSCWYGNLFKQIQKKGILKIDPSIKRSFCSRCNFAFTSESKMTSELINGDDFIAIECEKCSFVKKYPVNEKNKLWNDNPKAIQEILICCNEEDNES